MSLCPECLGRGFVYSPGGYAPKLVCPTCLDGEDDCKPDGAVLWETDYEGPGRDIEDRAARREADHLRGEDPDLE